MAPRLLLLDRGNGPAPLPQDFLGGGVRGRLIGQIELVEALAVEMGEASHEALARLSRELDLDRPVFPRLEGFDLGFALANEAKRHRLDAARRAAARQLAPEHGRQGEAHEVVERAARQIGVDQLSIELARMTERVENGRFRYFVEYHPLDVDALQRMALAQHLLDMPGDRLAFAVVVGREVEIVGALHRPGDVLEPLLGLAIDLPGHREPLVRAHRAVLGREVPDMAVARQDREALAQILVDGFRLGRRLDDDDFHGYRMEVSRYRWLSKIIKVRLPSFPAAVRGVRPAQAPAARQERRAETIGIAGPVRQPAAARATDFRGSAAVPRRSPSRLARRAESRSAPGCATPGAASDGPRS